MVNVFTTIVGTFRRLFNLLKAIAALLFFAIWLTIRDIYYVVCSPLGLCLSMNLPRPKVGSVVPSDQPGHGGVWPQFQAPIQATDSRSPCPAYVLLSFP
jgi:hypothetical protein